MNATAYVVAAYGVFAGLVSAYVAILVPRTRARRRELAALERPQERAES
jgi:Heme exporter protein D (CcmD)